MGRRSAIRGNNAPCYFDGFDVAHGKIGSRLISRTNCDRLRLIDLENPGAENRSILTAEGAICVRQDFPIRTLALPCQDRTARHQPGSSAHGQRHERAGPLLPIVRGCSHSWQMNDKYPQEEHQSQQSCGPTRAFFGGNGECCREKCDAHENRPEEASGNPCWHQRRHEPGVEKVLRAKYDQ